MAIKTVKISSWGHTPYVSLLEGHIRCVSPVAIVPNSNWVQEINKALTGKESILLGNSVYTLKSLIDEYFHIPRATISRSMQRFLIRNIIKSGGTKYFKTPSLGIVSPILDAITRLKSNLIRPDDLREILETRGGPKESDLLFIYSKYEDELTQLNLKDEYTFPQNLSKIDKKVHLIGFSDLPPVFELLFKELFHYKVKPESNPVPTIYELNSPNGEINFICRKIAELTESGIAPSDIGIYLKKGDPAAWKIASELERTGIIDYLPPQPNLLTNNIALEILNNPLLPEDANFETFKDILIKKLRGFDVEKEIDDKPYQGRAFSLLENFSTTINRLKFQYNKLSNDEKIERSELIEIIRDELGDNSKWPYNIPIRFIAYEDAGLYPLKASILPFLNDGYLPSFQQSVTFFADSDTLSPKPDERIDLLFPRFEKVLKEQMLAFDLALLRNTIATCHRYGHDGGESGPSPFIISNTREEITLPMPKYLPPQTGPCGQNLSDKTSITKLENILKNKTFSATQLEDYANCPFAYFCKNILGIEPPDDKTPDIQAKDKGTIIHESLEAFFLKHLDRFNKAIKEDSEWSTLLPIISNIVEEQFAKLTDIIEKYHPDMVTYYKTKAVRLLTNVLREEIVYFRDIPQRPAYFELKFEEKIQGIPFKGYIDRIDEDDQTFTTIDYKTGQIAGVRNGIKEGTELQIPIYTEMAGRKLKKEPAGAFLYSIKEQKRKSGIVNKELKDHTFAKKRCDFAVEPSEFEELIEVGLKKAVEYVNKIRAGQFEASPAKCESYCDWKDVCRFNKYA